MTIRAALLAVAVAAFTASSAPTLPLGGHGPAIAGVARTPPMGWDSWNTFGCGINAAAVRRAADAMVSSGMRDVGYRYVIVDDCWFDPERTPSGRLRADPVRFPGGMAALAAYVHARGLKFGIYESATDATCAQRAGTYPGSTGSAGHERADAQTFASWGVDYVKYDWCSTDASVSDQMRAFTAMRDALRATGRPIVYSINANSDIVGEPPGRRFDWAGIATLSRITNDVAPGWALRQGAAGYQGVGEIIDASAPLSGRSGPGHWNDPDMLEIGVAGQPGTSTPGLSGAEARTQFALWAMQAAPLIAGNALPTMPDATRLLLTARDIIAVDQDASGVPGTALPGTGAKVWRRPLSDGSVAVALYNPTDTYARIETTATRVGLPDADRYRVRDLWLNTVSATDGAVGAEVAPHDTVMLRISPLAVQ